MKRHLNGNTPRKGVPSRTKVGLLRVEVSEETDSDGSRYYMARALDLPGCISDGETAEQALEQLRDAADLYLSVPTKSQKLQPPPAETSIKGLVSSVGVFKFAVSRNDTSAVVVQPLSPSREPAIQAR